MCPYLKYIADSFIFSYLLKKSLELKTPIFCAVFVMLLVGHKFNLPDEIYRSIELGLTLGYVKDDTIIRARGLPWQVSDTDVADFFVGLNIAK